ncbi:RNA-binding protein Ro60-like [Rhynchophorus ferrugineus]|uniref:RNA-binding protein Ro60-like n=1 Tax=Rhynchophorus ferrugineus TaxID=354439 RepID=UPI003FCE4EBF
MESNVVELPSPLSLEDKVRRIIYKNNVGHTYFCGDPDRYQKDLCDVRLATINSSIANNLNEVFAVLDEANCDQRFPQRTTMFLFLGRLMHYDKLTPELKSKVTAKALSLFQTDEDFFDFIKYYTGLRTYSKLPSSVEKLVRKFYNTKTPEELARSFAKFNRLHKWTHKDLIKLSHVKPESPLKDKVIKYILKKQFDDTASEEDQKVLNIVKKAYELRSTKVDTKAINLLSELQLTIFQVLPKLRDNKQVWEAAIRNMTIQEILTCLEKLYKLNLLKPKANVSIYLTDLFTNSEKVKSSKIDPMEVFIFMKRLEKGGKPVDFYYLNYLEKEKKMPEEELKKLKTRYPARCAHLLSSLQKCFNIACNSLSSTNKRYMVTIEVTELAKNANCIGTKSLTFLEAAVAYALILLRTEKHVTIAVLRNDDIGIMDVEKNISFNDLLTKVKEQSSTYSSLAAPFEWAIREKKRFDVFISFFTNKFPVTYFKHQGVNVDLEPLNTYRKSLNMPDAKLVMFNLNGPSLFATKQKEDVVNVLDITGFDAVTYKTAVSFCRDRFC